MQRIIDYFLLEWKRKPERKPLLLRGARQVGKTHAVRTLGASFPTFVEINLELNRGARRIFEQDLDVSRIIFQLNELLQTNITASQTLLFIDEIQHVPQAIISLRYFYEKMPDLHVIAAGSLLDFAIEQVGVPVGRISTLYMYPLSFIEFLGALGHHAWIRSILSHTPESTFNQALHEKLMYQLGSYSAIGGMPEAVNSWVNTMNSRSVKQVHSDLVYTYEQDFGKYAKKHQIKYLHLMFLKAAEQLSNKFMYTRVGEYQKRELAPALELLERAGLIYRVTYSDAQGIPIGAHADLNDFKLIFLDVGLSQSLLKLDITPWFLNPLETFGNKGEIVEALIGQEILAYSDPISKESLFYWKNKSRASKAEIDYVLQLHDTVVPIEVKSGINRRIKSMHIFLASHASYARTGIRLWAGPYEAHDPIYSYPLYACAKICADGCEPIRAALKSLIPENL